MKVLFATTNSAKVKYYANRLLKDGIELVTLKDLNIKIPNIPIIDFQAGSGDGILKSATKSGFPLILQGTEFRSLDNLGLDKETLDFRYQVETNKNSNL